MQRCAIYTRKSTEDGLDQDFNSLDAQRKAAKAYITSQAGQGWQCLPQSYDDGGHSGAHMDRPALTRLLGDVQAGKIDIILVYKVDRFSRSLMDFAKIIDLLEHHKVAFVSVTQHFNTATSMGRLILNVLLSFAQFERETIAERVRDKVWAARKLGKYTGGPPPLGYRVIDRKLVVIPEEAQRVRAIFELYLQLGSSLPVVRELNRRGWRTKRWPTKKGNILGDKPFDRTSLYNVLANVTYLGKVRFKKECYEGEHEAVIDQKLWDRVHAHLASNRRNFGNRVRHTSLLQGLITCGVCEATVGHTYTKRGNKKYRYYTCTRVMKEGRHACTARPLPADDLESLVPSHIGAVAQNAEMLNNLAGEVQLSSCDLRSVLETVQTNWSSFSGVQRQRWIDLLIENLTLHEASEELTITFNSQGLHLLVAEHKETQS